jgi:predicted phage baseplate assembly protein
VTSPLAVVGGEDEESVDQAAGRAVGALQAPSRAITAADYETLALNTPGTVVARARALPGVAARLPGLVAPGVVTVLVVPADQSSRPTPSPGLLRAVATYLNRRRVVGTHVEVVAPSYAEITVTTTVRTRVGADQTTVRSDVLTALAALFDPLTGGFDGAGWPFGRTVYRTEVLQAIDAVTGVDTVLSLEMAADGQPAQCGNLCIGPTQLVASGQHAVEVTSA